MRRRSAHPALLTAAALLVLMLVALTFAGCGNSKEGIISPDQHSRVQKGMTLDDVEAITGPPLRTHRTGSTRDPTIIWYYGKTEGEGLVRITFEGGKVVTITPYNESVEAQE